MHEMARPKYLNKIGVSYTPKRIPKKYKNKSKKYNKKSKKYKKHNSGKWRSLVIRLKKMIVSTQKKK